MEILKNVIDNDRSDDRVNLNATKVFNLTKIKNELSRYDIEVTFSNRVRYSDDLWVIYAYSPYKGRIVNIMQSPKESKIALFFNYETRGAFAMPRSGSDKQTMMAIASVANKNIQQPFEYDPDIRWDLVPGGKN